MSLTTRTSPARRYSGRSEKVRWSSLAARALEHQQPARVPRLDRLLGDEPGGKVVVEVLGQHGAWRLLERLGVVTLSVAQSRGVGAPAVLSDGPSPASASPCAGRPAGGAVGRLRPSPAVPQGRRARTRSSSGGTCPARASGASHRDRSRESRGRATSMPSLRAAASPSSRIASWSWYGLTVSVVASAS